MSAAIAKVNFMSLTTPILAYAGISIGKDLDMFKKAGWRLVIVACVVFTGTFLGSAVIAQALLKLMGQI
jgi:Ca2+/H+ antiporter